jgi:hypothetical protein
MTNNPDRVYFDKLAGILSEIDFAEFKPGSITLATFCCLGV